MNKLILLSTLCCLLSSCHVGRFVVYNWANITDHKIFPATEISPSPDPRYFTAGESIQPLLDSVSITNKKFGALPLTRYLAEETSTTAFLVIRNDSILFEEYYRGYDAGQRSTFFSVSKSITSLLVGIAVDEGAIESIDDPVTKYIPELLDDDPLFQRQTIRHLLAMRSGLDYTESYSNPFAPMAKLYYGTNQLRQIENMDFREEPGTKHRYQSVSTALLGIVVEKATGVPLGEYLEQKVWHPAGMEFAASMSLDDKKNRSAKAYSGVNATARDLAKIGRLYLNNGRVGDQRIVAPDWIEASVTPDPENDFYQYQWYGVTDVVEDDEGELIYFDSEADATGYTSDKGLENAVVFASRSKPGKYYVESPDDAYYAQGILNQLLFVDPSQNLIIVRLGKRWDGGYIDIMQGIAGKLEVSAPTRK